MKIKLWTGLLFSGLVFCVLAKSDSLKKKLRLPFKVTEQVVCVPPDVAAILIDTENVNICPDK